MNLRKRLITLSLIIGIIWFNLVGCAEESEFDDTYYYNDDKYITVSGLTVYSTSEAGGSCELHNVYGVASRYQDIILGFMAKKDNTVKIMASDNANLYWTGTISEDEKNDTKTISFKGYDYVK